MKNPPKKTYLLKYRRIKCYTFTKHDPINENFKLFFITLFTAYYFRIDITNYQVR